MGQTSTYFQAALGYGCSDKSQQQLQAAQGNARPVATDWAEKPMLHRIPFGSAAREMAHRDLQIKSVREFLLEQFLEMPETIAIAATRVGRDPQFVKVCLTIIPYRGSQRKLSRSAPGAAPPLFE